MSPVRSAPATARTPWAATPAELADALGVDLACGLGTPVAQLRLRESGPNELPAERPRSLLRSVLTELRETMIVVLMVAAALTAVTGDLTDVR
jgi:Ca2+-transporting ATPase